jgi:DNA-binding NtrC family response regulator
MSHDASGDKTATSILDRATLGNRAYLLLIEDGSSSMVPLPNQGAITIGRAPDVELRVDHASVSRRHARILIERGQARLCDLNSHNGTRLNGVQIDGERILTTGDVISIGEVLLVVHAEFKRELPQVILDEASWRQRLAEEVERAVTFQRSLAVLAITGASAYVHGALRAIDVIGRGDDRQLLALLPEADPATARQLAAILFDAMRAASPEGRIGIASCPFDATDPDNIILAARAAAAVAGAAGIATAAETAHRIELGDRHVLVCHPAMIRVFGLLERLAKADLPVLIIGETGVGKENAAYAVHYYSERRSKPFVALNCAAVPEALIESQLFGHDKGAFTGAVTARAGLFETASGGTLFLDEIGELTPAVQAKLLRALETKRITRVGETKEREIDLRIVAATNRLLEQEVEAKRFREDLYFRLGAARVHLLPVRDRRCEIPMLFREFIERASRQAGRTPPEPTPQVVQRMLAYRWPGNVRELKHVAEFVMATVDADDDQIELSDLPEPLASAHVQAESAARASIPGAPMRRLADELEEIERQRIAEALTKTQGVKTRAAALLGMPLRTFNMKVKQYGL